MQADDASSAPASGAAPGKPKRRNAERTRARILEVAIGEFSEHGYEGARVERVVNAAGVAPRMIYHYFGNKEQLYLAVLETVYAELRAGERALDLDAGEPVEAIRRLVGYTFDFFQRNKTFVQITRGENMLSGRYVSASPGVRDMSQPLIDEIGRVLDLGVAEGAFRTGIDPLQLYVSIVALSVHHINNAATLSATFGRDLTKADWLAERRAHVVDMIMSTVRRGAGASAG